MPKKRKRAEYNMINQITPEEHLKHCEDMVKFWKNVCPTTAGQYASKARKLREELGIVK